MTGTEDVAAHQDALREHLAALRELLVRAKAMPMSASCVVNRADALALVDAAVAAIPEQPVVRPARAEAEAVLAQAKEEAAALVAREAIVQQAKVESERLVSDARNEAEGLRTETDAFVDSRMASFESVLHKTLSQVQLARTRLSQRSGLDDVDE